MIPCLLWPSSKWPLSEKNNTLFRDGHMYVAKKKKKILKLNCSPRCQKLKSVISGIRVHITLPPEALAPSEPAWQESILTHFNCTAWQGWPSLEEVRERGEDCLSAQENTVTPLISSGKQEGCAKTDLENPRTRRKFVVSRCFLSELFFSCERSIISRQIHASWTVSASVRRGRCTHCLFVVDLKLTGVWATGAEPAGYS